MLTTRFRVPNLKNQPQNCVYRLIAYRLESKCVSGGQYELDVADRSSSSELLVPSFVVIEVNCTVSDTVYAGVDDRRQ